MTLVGPDARFPAHTVLMMFSMSRLHVQLGPRRSRASYKHDSTQQRHLLHLSWSMHGARSPQEMALCGQAFRQLLQEATLPVALGRAPSGVDIAVDLVAMAHLLIGGTPGSGKSSAIHAMITSLLCTSSPCDLRFILIDSKGVELTAR